jgi:Mg2+ and Co2+ transporter CorA|tara:strand:+ start:70 stop:264 length:195 start_codon:yes stop_codon:yes gene_type:complete
MTRAALLLEHGILRNKMEMTPFLKKCKADDAIVVMLWDDINKEFKKDQEKLGDEAYQLYDDICG